MTAGAMSWIRLGSTLALAVFVAWAVFTAPAPAEDRAEQIGSLIRCPVCSGEAIADSPSSLARDMMSLVREGVEAGLTDDQVVESVVGAYGSDAQVLDPPIDASTIALVAIPALVMAGGAGLIMTKRRSRITPEPVTAHNGEKP